MKTLITISKTAFTLLFLISVMNIAQESVARYELADDAIGNLRNGITSDNTGLKKSAIYFAGKYQVTELEKDLIKEMNGNPDIEIKILIAKVLHRMYSYEGMKNLVKMISESNSPKFVRIATHLVKDYNQNHYTVSTGK